MDVEVVADTLEQLRALLAQVAAAEVVATEVERAHLAGAVDALARLLGPAA